MKNTFPSYYKKFYCIADKCPDTCCAGWEIVVDSESIKKYAALNGNFADKINGLIVTDADGDKIFSSCNGRCPFLLENGLCKMYIELGHDSLCKTCRLFPRHITYFGARCETGISLSCPEAARIIMENPEPISFETEETNGEIMPTSIDGELYFTLLDARKKAIDILQNRKISIEERICTFLEFAQALNSPIKHLDFDEAKEIIDGNFPRVEHINSHSRAKRALKRYFDDFAALEVLDTSWRNSLTQAENLDVSSFGNNEWEYEHLMVYFVFRYFMAAVFDRDILTKAKFAAVSFIVIRQLQAMHFPTSKALRTETMQKYSKEVEHSANNMDFLFAAMKKSRFYSIENLINILSEKEKIL